MHCVRWRPLVCSQITTSMNHKLLLQVRMLALCVSVALSGELYAQESDDSTDMSWWTFGTGGVLDATNDDGDTVSGTVGQIVVDSTDDGTGYGKFGHGAPRRPTTTLLGFWLPRRAADDDAHSLDGTLDKALEVISHPNPFNGRTVVQYVLPEDGHVRLEIFDVRGKRVRLLVNGSRLTGDQQEVWDGHDNAGLPLASGSYFLRLTLTTPAGRSRFSMSSGVNLVD